MISKIQFDRSILAVFLAFYFLTFTFQFCTREEFHGNASFSEIMKSLNCCVYYAGINLTGYHPPGHPGAFAPKCVHSPGAFAQQKMPGGRANKG